jgi:hypothetical protein
VQLFTSSPLVLLRYVKKDKIRPLVLRDALVKVVWAILIADIVDENLKANGSASGNRGSV